MKRLIFLKIVGANQAAKLLNEKKAKKYIISNFDDCLMLSVNPGDSFGKIIDKSNAAYAFGNMDPSIHYPNSTA
jgi:hypothetical protein